MKRFKFHNKRVLMNEKMFEMHQSYAPQMKPILKKLNCDVKSIEALDEGYFVINFKKHNSSEVNDGNLNVVGKGFFKQPQFGFTVPMFLMLKIKLV